MKFVFALLVSSIVAVKINKRGGFATGMNGDEDLG